MKHKYSHIYVSVYGICEKCKQVVESKEGITTEEMERFILSGVTLRELKLQKAYDKFSEHECTI